MSAPSLAALRAGLLAAETAHQWVAVGVYRRALGHARLEIAVGLGMPPRATARVLEGYERFASAEDARAEVARWIAAGALPAWATATMGVSS